MFTGEKNQFDWKLKLRKWSKRLHEDWCSWGKDILLNVKLKFKAYFFGSRSLALQIDFFLLDSHFMSLRYNNRTNEKAKENRILLFFFFLIFHLVYSDTKRKFFGRCDILKTTYQIAKILPPNLPDNDNDGDDDKYVSFWTHSVGLVFVTHILLDSADFSVLFIAPRKFHQRLVWTILWNFCEQQNIRHLCIHYMFQS